MAQVAGWKPAPEAPGSTPPPGNQQGWASAPEAPATPAPSALPKPAELKPDDRGVWNSVKRNTVGMARGLYHAAVDPATPDEQAAIEKERQVMPGQQEVSRTPADLKERLHSRLIDQPREQVLAEPNRTLTSTVLANIPLVGPQLHSIAQRYLAGDKSGAITDVASMMAAEHPVENLKAATHLALDVSDASGLHGFPGRQPTPVQPLSRTQMVRQVQAENIQRGVAQSEKHVLTALPPSKSAPWESADYQRAKPYIDQHASTVGGSGVERFRDTLDTGLESIEGHLHDMIEANPQDQITTNPREAVRASLADSRAAVDSTFVQQGLKDLERFNLDNPTVTEADAIRWKINQENKGVRLRNHYDQATAMATDPAYAAREAAADSLREGVYGKLAERGMPGAQQLRQTEGSIIKLRNAAEKAIYSGDKAATGARPGMVRSLARTAIRATPTPALLADPLANALTPDPLTRNQLLDKAMSLKGSARPVYPAIPAAPQVAGLLTEGARPPIITPPPADTSGTPAVPETGPQTVHPLPPRKPPNAAGQADVTAPAVATGGTMAPIPEPLPPPGPGQRLLPPAEPLVTGGPTKAPTEKPPRKGPGMTRSGARSDQTPPAGVTPPKTETPAAKGPETGKATPQAAKPLKRLTVEGIRSGDLGREALTAIIDDTSQPPKIRNAAYNVRASRGMPRGVVETTEEGKPLPKAKPGPGMQRPPKQPPVAERYSPEIIEQAKAEMRGASELSNSLGRPGRYYAEAEHEQGEYAPTSAGKWYGINATKPAIAGQYPWFAGEDMSMSLLEQALEKGKGAAYERIVEKIARQIQQEQAKKP